MPSSFNTLLSSALVYSTCPPVSVSGTVYNGGAISWNLFAANTNPIRTDDLRDPSHTTRYRNINLFPIDYPLRARLRGRLTLRGLALRRNPWTFGERVSHPLCRYSCPHSHFPYLHGRSRIPLHRLRERSATTHFRASTASADGLSPVTFSPRDSY